MDIRDCNRCGNQFDKDLMKIKSLRCNDCVKKARMDRYHNKQKFDLDYMNRSKQRNITHRDNLTPEDKDNLKLVRVKRNKDNLEAYMELRRKGREKHRDSIADYYKQWHSTHQEHLKEYRRLNHDKQLLYASNRRARKLQAMPKWLSVEEIDKIREMYKECKQMSTETGVVHHVDHIYPLRGKDSCGLHVPWNLQIIIGTDNLKKSNKISLPYSYGLDNL